MIIEAYPGITFSEFAGARKTSNKRERGTRAAGRHLRRRR
jgi:hypothetical protein